MTNGIFKRLGNFCFARGENVMSTESETGFEWSMKLIGHHFYVGVASQLRRGYSLIADYDRNAILYCLTSSNSLSMIKMGSNEIHSNLENHKDGDVIRFRFQPQAKKLLIDLVRISWTTNTSLTI